MTHINLLPWREQRREERRREFLVLLIGVVMIAAGMLFLVDRNFRWDIRHQQSRNDFLRQEIQDLDAKIVEISQLKDQYQQIHARMSAIQQLQEARSVIVRILDGLVKCLPTGVHFNSLTRTGDQLAIQGVAETSSRVSELMRRLDDSDWFENPVLQQISVAGDDVENQASANVFSLTLGLRQMGQAREN